MDGTSLAVLRSMLVSLLLGICLGVGILVSEIRKYKETIQ
jgi:hypothetical protein